MGLLKMLIKTVFALSISLVSVAVSATTVFDRMKLEAPGQALQAPEFALTTLNDETVNLSDYQGKVVVVNFWATYCIPCRIEMPSLERLSQHYDDRELAVIAISLDEDKERVIRKLVNKMNLSFAIALEGQQAGKDYEVSVLPVTFVIGKQGELLGRAVGDRDWADEDAIQLMDTILSN